MPIWKPPHRRKALALALASLSLLTLGLWTLLPAARGLAQEVASVLVVNFPEVQRVGGEVAVQGTVRHARFDHRGEVLVPTADPNDTTQLVAGGTLSTDGFTRVVLSLSGEMKGRVVRPGEVGAILIPDEEPVLTVFREESLFQFPLKISAQVPAAAPFVSSSSVELAVAFPRYRVFFYNTSDRTVGVHLFGYLTH